jgi:hypothetical protein
MYDWESPSLGSGFDPDPESLLSLPPVTGFGLQLIDEVLSASIDLGPHVVSRVPPRSIFPGA